MCRFSWIHLDDIVNLIYEALRNPAYKGKSSSIPKDYSFIHQQSNQLAAKKF